MSRKFIKRSQQRQRQQRSIYAMLSAQTIEKLIAPAIQDCQKLAAQHAIEGFEGKPTLRTAMELAQAKHRITRMFVEAVKNGQ